MLIHSGEKFLDLQYIVLLMHELICYELTSIFIIVLKIVLSKKGGKMLKTGGK